MSTPPRLVRVKCPNCAASHWVVNCDFPGEGTPWLDLPYEARTYQCPHCGNTGAGYQVQEKSPAEFLMQPHEMYPMGEEEFDEWVGVFHQNFPDCPKSAEYGKPWDPEKQRALVLQALRYLFDRGA